MFGLGMPEILLILAIALIVIGPTKLPDLAKTLGRAMGEFKRSAQDFKRSIDIETTVKDVEPPSSDSLKKVLKDVNKKSDPPETEAASPRQDPVSDTSDTSDKTDAPPPEEDEKDPASKA